MPTLILSNRAALGLAAALALASSDAPSHAGQDGPGAAPAGVEAIDAEFAREVRALERKRLGRLAELAAGQPKDQAEATYRAYLRDALEAGLYDEAEPVAERIIERADAPADLRYLAHAANILAEVDRGDFDGSLKSLASAVAAEGDEGKAAAALPIAVRFRLAEAYYQKLVQAGQYDVARRAFALLRDGAADPAFREFAADRLARLDMVGQPAPPLAGPDVDGKPFRLADLRGDVVLVTFWASWALPSAAEAGRLAEIGAEYRDRGLRIVGVNLDALDHRAGEADSVLPDVRRFLVDHNVTWPNLVSGAGAGDIAAAWGVREVPANFLIGRDGRIVAVDLSGPPLERAIAEATRP